MNPPSSIKFMQLPTSQLVEDPDRVRRYFSTGEKQALRTSIKEFGLLAPLVVMDTGTGTYTVIDGALRLLCCRELGIDEVPCAVNPPMTPTEVVRLQFELESTVKPLSKRDQAAQLRRIKELTEQEKAA